LHLHDQGRDPGGQVFRLFKLVLVIVVAPPEGGDAALAFKGAELERRERQRADLGDELVLALGGDEVRLVAQASGAAAPSEKRASCSDTNQFAQCRVEAIGCRKREMTQPLILGCNCIDAVIALVPRRVAGRRATTRGVRCCVSSLVRGDGRSLRRIIIELTGRPGRWAGAGCCRIIPRRRLRRPALLRL
jgi:hypothetical protein